MPELIRVLRSRIRALLKRRQLERDLQDELSFHLLEKQSALEASGVAVEEAQRLAQRRLGNSTALKESCRDAWLFSGFETTMRDAKYAARVLAKNPTFTAIAILTLAFGIGANTAIFSVIDSVILRALPYPEPDRLYRIREVAQQGAQREELTCVNAGNFLLWGPHAQSFAGMALIMPTTDNLLLKDETVQIHGARVSADLFDVLGIPLQAGRAFTLDEDTSGKANSIVLTNSLWKRHFRSDPAIVGSTILLNGFPFVVTGVLPESFYFPKQNELYASTIATWTHPIEYFVNLGLGSYETKPGWRMFNFAAIGRLRPDANAKRATQQLDVGEAQASVGGPAGARLQIALVPLKAAVTGPAEHNLWMLMSGAGLVLLLVCVNIAGLLIAKGAGRAHEIGIRTSLGAGRADIVRQFLIEGLFLSLTGGVLGLIAAYVGVRGLVHAAPIDIPRLGSVGIAAKTLAFNAAISAGVGIIFSLLPALRLSAGPASQTLKAAGPATSSGRSVSRMHAVLAASEIALATVLLVSALLVAQSLARVLQTNAWASVSQTVTLDFAAPADHYQKHSDRARLYRTLLGNARSYPGVEAVGITSALPLRGEMWGDDVKFVEAPRPDKDTPNANWRFISPDYFSAAGILLVSGRSFSESDTNSHGVLISQSLARQLPRGLNPLDVHIYWTPPDSGKASPYHVIGVVADVRAMPDEDAPNIVYLPYWEWPPWSAAFVVRSKGDARAVASAMQKLIRKTDSEIAIPNAVTMRDVLSKAVAPRTFVTGLGLLFAASATFLAAVGLYGLISLSVTQRTREIGIRMAVGARANQIFRGILSQAFVLATIGLACGSAAAIAATRLLRTFLFEIRPGDPGTLAAVCAGLLIVSLAASYLPARRATRVDPVKALKWE